MSRLKITNLLFLCIIMALSLSSCEAIAGIFKAGMWFGIIGIIVIVAIILWIINKARK